MDFIEMAKFNSEDQIKNLDMMDEISSEEDLSDDDENANNDSTEESLMDSYDAEKGFVSDFPVKQGTPASFGMAIQSDVIMQNYFFEVSNRYSSTKSNAANKTAEMRAREKKDALDYVVRNSPEYQYALQKGKEEAAAAQMNYDPAADPNIWMIQDMADEVDFYETGHAKLALRAYDEQKAPLSSYSFGFRYKASHPFLHYTRVYSETNSINI